MQTLASMLGAAKKPLAILGGGGWTETGRAAIRSFFVAHDLPVAVAFRRQALYDGTLDNSVGDLGVGPDPALVARVREADLILAVGTRLGEAVSQGYTLFGQPRRRQAGPCSTRRRARSAASSARHWASCPTSTRSPPRRPRCRRRSGRSGHGRRSCASIREASRAVPNQAGKLNLGAVMRELEGLLTPDAICTCDAGNFAGWPQRFINFTEGQRFFGPTNGAMGYSVPAAVGLKIANPDRMVVSFVGDGGFMMTGQEIATAFHHGVAPIVLVFNNQMYGTIRMYQERSYPGRVSGTALTNPDFAKLIEAFGGHGETVTSTAEFAPAFRRAVESGARR